MFNLNSIKIVNSHQQPETPNLSVTLATPVSNTSGDVPIVSTKKFVRKGAKPAKKVFTAEDRERALNTLIKEVNEVDEDTGKPVLTHKECVKNIIGFIQNNYIDEKKVLKV